MVADGPQIYFDPRLVSYRSIVGTILIKVLEVI